MLKLNSGTLATQGSVVPQDPATNTPARFIDYGTAAPTIGPDGDVYMGVFDNANTSRGWMEHYSANLATTKTPGGFGWDDTVSIVPASMVPSYHGTSTYLLMTKYNNYASGQNMIAILDPNAPAVDNQRNGGTGAIIMQTVLTQLGPTPNPDNGGVYEWCDNDAVVDPATDSVLVTSEDGNLYRWNLATGALTQSINLGTGLGAEALHTMDPDRPRRHSLRHQQRHPLRHRADDDFLERRGRIELERGWQRIGPSARRPPARELCRTEPN